MTASPQWVAPRAKSSIEPTGRTTFNFGSADRPRLLVSVRSADEAHSALAGGAEILDIKDPLKGSLGMSDIETISDIATIESVAQGVTPLSAALGEALDWNSSKPVPSLPPGITYAKLGLSGCSSQSDWREIWDQVRTAFQRQSGAKLTWVAVAYADAAEAQSPAIEDVLQAAQVTGCAGLLIDTWTKGRRSLLDFLDPPTLKMMAAHCHQAGLFFALAGKLSRDSLKHIAGVPADVIAIRSAACRNTERTSQLDSNQVNAFRHELKNQFIPTTDNAHSR
ncbi:(5-formylfuran-3-yl)methyl phosphate synthase [Schlesneria paludicola]|uniref:(5-formylfuran-3-yl)methyl phosphate synthase n=1 Tax=Schlesneria paludicola TaxID=360056 RepID=UPI00029AB56E|nr:(5-formylfuran-3-yl)methyl phosphate synthase [Schlesneria paludicola]